MLSCVFFSSQSSVRCMGRARKRVNRGGTTLASQSNGSWIWTPKHYNPSAFFPLYFCPLILNSWRSSSSFSTAVIPLLTAVQVLRVASISPAPFKAFVRPLYLNECEGPCEPCDCSTARSSNPWDSLTVGAAEALGNKPGSSRHHRRGRTGVRQVKKKKYLFSETQEWN